MKWAVKWAVGALSQVACVVCTRPGDEGAVRTATLGGEDKGVAGLGEGAEST